ncbi:cytochrome P450 [Phellopilus nigrolimitatus]|nr:cytochrome P450 [Phellopilus nigrolimitatus]
MDILLRRLWSAAQSHIYVFCSLSLAVVVFYIVSVAIYRLFLSPLRGIPGPWYAAVSDIWLVSHVLRLRRCRALDDLFLKYGPIVRMAPNKILFVDVPAMKTVYGVSSRLSKSSWYKALLTNNNDHAMTTLEHSAHQIRKKGYTPHYNPKHLALFESEIHGFVKEMIDMLNVAESHSLIAVDTLLLLRHLMIDINCMHLFAYNVHSLPAWKQHNIGAARAPSDLLSMAIEDFPKRGVLKSALPVWLWSILTYIPNQRVQLLFDSDRILSRFVEDRVRETRISLQSGKSSADDNEKMSLVMRLLHHKYSEREVMPEEDIVSECVGHLIAGSDTTSTTLSYLLYELSQRRDVMLRLQAELSGVMHDPLQIPDIQVLQRLPYLTAVIKEGLRVYTAAPSPLERVVPEAKSEYMLLGHGLPSGTIIASQAWSSHRHPNVFFSPELFLPDRWLLENPAALLSPSSDTSTSASAHSASLFPALSDAEKGSVSRLNTTTIQAQMAEHMFPFGHGSRVCGGQNMAQNVLRIVLAALVRNFDVVAPPETNERSMEIKDSFVIFPASMECKLIFVPRSL